MTYTYSYAIGLIFPAIFWLIIFISRRDLRREMLIFSSLAGFFAPLLAYIHTFDWWAPQTITGTVVGFEDFFYAFFICGLATSIYQFIFNIKFSENKRVDVRILYLLGIGFTLFVPLSLIFNSIIGFFVPAIITLLFVLYHRPELKNYAIFSGLFVTIISIPSYLLIEFLTPGWIASTWFLENFSGIFLLKIPIEEFIWHALAGASMSVVYKYWHSSKLVKTNIKNVKN